MTAPRLTPIPIEHMEAEIAAYPLASERALELGMLALDPALPGGLDRELWRSAENTLLPAFPTLALDELVAMRDRLWFGDPCDHRPRSMGAYLRSLAAKYLRAHGHVAVPRYLEHDATTPRPDDHALRARVRWRWMSFALPPDLLLAALDSGPEVADRVELVTPTLDRYLRDHGFAETHLHQGASFDFSLLWAAAMRGIADSGFRPDALRSPGACLDEGEILAPWLLRTGLIRYVLAGYLAHIDDRASNADSHVSGLRQFFDETLGASVSSADVAILLSRPERSELEDPALFHQLRSMYCDWTSFSPTPPETIDDVYHRDPIASLVSRADCHLRNPEQQLISRALDYLENHDDRFFAALFWQCVRVRCLLYRHIVQRPMTPGLQWFVRFFGRAKPLKKQLPTSARLQYAALPGMTSLEIRGVPEESPSEQLAVVRTLARAPAREPDAPRPERALIIHFARERGGGWKKGLPEARWHDTLANPVHEFNHGYRYAMHYNRTRREAQTVVRTLTAFPRTLEILRGIDLCTDEAGVPTWVMAPLVHHIRDAGLAVSQLLLQRIDRDVPPLRASIHAGEDFVHLLSGLRRIDWTLEFLALDEGDRLGHALALGVDPAIWTQRTSHVSMSTEERLMDLTWEWRCYARDSRARIPSGRRLWLEQRIADLAGDIFGQPSAGGPYRARDCAQLIEHLHDAETLRTLGFPNDGFDDLDALRGDREAELLHRYLGSPAAFQRGRRIIRVPVADDAEVLGRLQNRMRARVGALGIAVEVNPSSNLLIGHLGELSSHPMLRLPGTGGSGAPGTHTVQPLPPIRVCIGSDDPCTFATDLREDYQWLDDALRLSGRSAHEARAWLDDARRVGVETRLTLASSKEPICAERPEEGGGYFTWPIPGAEPALDPPP